MVRFVTAQSRFYSLKGGCSLSAILEIKVRIDNLHIGFTKNKYLKRICTTEHIVNYFIGLLPTTHSVPVILYDKNV